MRPSIRNSRLALILSLGLGLTACAGKDKASETPDQLTEQYRQEILATVGDADRAEPAAALAEKLRLVFVAEERQLKVDMKTFQSLNADFNATEAQFQAFFETLNARIASRQGEVVAIHSEMQAQLTADEWKQLKSARKDALEIDLGLL